MALKISLDAMGGDNTPQAAVTGVCQFARENPEVIVKLVGRENDLLKLQQEAGAADLSNIEIVHADEVVGMDESPVSAVKEKKDSSIARAVRLVKEGEADAVMSAGNTGVAVAQATLGLKRIPGMKRPGIITPLPSEKGIFYMIDAGANSESKPEFLFQHALMGALFCRPLLDVKRSRVAFLNIGTEETKGNVVVQEAHRMLSEVDEPFLEYTGFVEGTDMFRGDHDLVVCEGFVGNVTLKLAEGVAGSMMRVIKQEVSEGGLLQKAGAAIMKSTFVELKERFGYERYGGALLLGVNGVFGILHGRSQAIAFANGLATTAKICRAGIIDEIKNHASLLQKD